MNRLLTLSISLQLAAASAAFAGAPDETQDRLPNPANALGLYAKLTGKTVLKPATLEIVSNLNFSKSNAISEIEAELARQKIAVVQDGPHLVILFPEAERITLTNVLSLAGPHLSASPATEILPAGVLDFRNVDVREVMKIYAELSRRAVLQGLTLPGIITLRNTCRLTRAEAIHAMEVVFALNGTAVIRDGEKFAEAVAVVQWNMVNPHAPKPEPNAKLLDPKSVPSSDLYEAGKPLTKTERDLQRWRKAFYDFIHYKPSPDRSAQRLLDLYADLADKTAVEAKEFEGMPVWFHVNTSLTKAELMYAIETTLDLHWLKIVEVDKQQLRLGRAPGRKR